MSLRFGLLGTGYWAEQTHGAALAAHPDADFVGVWGRDADKAAAVGLRYGITAYTDVDALIEDVDAVAVALPPHVQAELAVRAAEAGRHLLLDKPLALTLPAADRVVEAAASGGAASVIFFTSRFFDNIAGFLSQAATGTWDGARVTMFASIFESGSPYSQSEWRREYGGLWDIGPHALSVILPVLGPVVEVAAMEGTHATTHVLLRHASGATSTLALTLDAPAAARSQEFLFHGASGLVAVPGGDGTAVDAFGRAIGQLVATVAAGSREHPCDVRFGRDVVAILAAADRARRDGRTHRLAD